MRSRGVWGSENETGQDKIRGMPSQSSAEERKEMEKKKKEDQRVGGDSFYLCGDDSYC